MNLQLRHHQNGTVCLTHILIAKGWRWETTQPPLFLPVIYCLNTFLDPVSQCRLNLPLLYLGPSLWPLSIVVHQLSVLAVWPLKLVVNCVLFIQSPLRTPTEPGFAQGVFTSVPVAMPKAVEALRWDEGLFFTLMGRHRWSVDTSTCY